MQRDCLGGLNWSESQFWESSYKAVYNALLGKSEQTRRQWELERQGWFFTMLAAHPNHYKNKQPKHLIEFEWEKKKKKPNKKQLERQRALFAKWDAEMKEKSNG